MAGAVFFEKVPIAIGQEQLRHLRKLASREPLGRARYCLHQDHASTVQQMVICLLKKSYICPHRYRNNRKSFIVVQGSMAVIFFDSSGAVVRKVEMGPADSGKPFAYHFSGDEWHTMVSLSDTSFYVETTPGPFDRDRTEWASWAPTQEDAAGIKEFLTQIGSAKRQTAAPKTA